MLVLITVVIVVTYSAVLAIRYASIFCSLSFGFKWYIFTVLLKEIMKVMVGRRRHTQHSSE